MNQWYKATVKVEFEDAKGRVKFRKEAYIVSAMTPSEVENKIAKQLEGTDYEIVGINTTNIVEIIK
jgi:hypothetical protein